MSGRWPANVILSPSMSEALDEQTGILRNGGASDPNAEMRADVGIQHLKHRNPSRFVGDSGGASRFFLTAGYEPWEYDWIIANGLTPCGE